MNLIKLLNKFTIITFWVLIIFFIGLLVYLNNTDNLKNYHYGKDIKKILKKNKKNFLYRILNDNNETFLPETQFINLTFNNYELDFLKLNDCYIGKCYTFFIEKYKNNIFLIDKMGNLYFSNIEDFLNENIKFTKIETNLNFKHITDLYISNDHIYVSGYLKQENLYFTSIYKSLLNLNNNKLKFNQIFKSENDKCIFDPPHAGKMKHYNYNGNNGLLFTTRWMGKTDNPNSNNLSEENICGKILLIDEKNSKYQIFSKGHRNIIGLYVDKDLILATENGPRGGDEINKIYNKKNYGWPISSYGDKYYRLKSDDKVNYKKNHKNYNFEEPIFSFIPSIGITEIIKLENNFSNFWQDNFLVGSLNKKTLYRVMFNKEFNKLIYLEEIFIGDRIRDLIYLEDKKIILLSLEMSGSIGVIKK